MTDQLKQLSEAEELTRRAKTYVIEVRGEMINLGDYIETLEAQLTEARAQVAMAYEVAAKAVEPYYNDQDGNRVPILGSPDAAAIRALTPDHTTTALEQIKADADKAGFERGIREAIAASREPIAQIIYDGWFKKEYAMTSHGYQKVQEAVEAAILATLSADTQENSDE